MAVTKISILVSLGKVADTVFRLKQISKIQSDVFITIAGLGFNISDQIYS
jgi:hypothetical protein